MSKKIPDLAGSMIRARHAFERFNESWQRAQNEERRQRELNKHRNQTARIR